MTHPTDHQTALAAARDRALRLATAHPTVKNRRALKKAERDLEEYLRAAAEPEVEETFESVLEVVDYLEGEGFKVSKSSAYDHWKKDGKLRARSDGRFALGDVLSYAHAHLQRKDGSPSGGNLQEEKQRAEIARINADARTRELKLRTLSGELIPRDQVEVELAERATNLKNYFANVARTSAGRIIKIVGGDPQQAPELIKWMLAMNAKAFDNYARPIKGIEEEEE